MNKAYTQFMTNFDKKIEQQNFDYIYYVISIVTRIEKHFLMMLIL
jgi:hypothetical protein